MDVPLLMTLTCCGALGRPLSQALGSLVAAFEWRLKQGVKQKQFGTFEHFGIQ